MKLTATYYRLFLLLMLLLSACGEKEKIKSYLDIPNPKTLGETFVSNPDNILQPATVADLNQVLRELDISGRAHIDVVVVESIGDALPKDVATALFRKWLIGAKETNNGLLMLLVNDQRRMEFETGYGLEGDLPDVICHRIQQQYMVPHAKNNDLDMAVREGVAATIRQLQTGNMHIAGADSAITAPGIYDAPAAIPDTMVYADPLPFVDEPYNPYAQEPQVGIMTLVLMVAFIVLMCIVDNRLWGSRFKVRIISPMFWLLCIGPIVGVFYLNWLHQTEWYDTRAFLIFYSITAVYLSVYFPLLGRRMRRRLKDNTRYEQYVALDREHYRMGWARYLFPLPYLWLYWAGYKRQMEQLRNAPYNCAACGAAMSKLAETDDDEYIEKGHAAEEKVKSVDYDVWACTDAAHAKQILVYKNLATTAKACPKCSYLTFMPDGRQVVEQATTSSEGWGWIKQRCHFCDHREKQRYTIPKVSTSSSGGSSGSSSSSGFSSSSGGSSGGGGAGSSW